MLALSVKYVFGLNIVYFNEIGLGKAKLRHKPYPQPVCMCFCSYFLLYIVCVRYG